MTSKYSESDIATARATLASEELSNAIRIVRSAVRKGVRVQVVVTNWDDQGTETKMTTTIDPQGVGYIEKILGDAGVPRRAT